jgi:hypothetical protein
MAEFISWLINPLVLFGLIVCAMFIKGLGE